MVNLKKSERPKDADIVQPPLRTVYPDEYEDYIAEEIIPSKPQCQAAESPALKKADVPKVNIAPPLPPNKPAAPIKLVFTPQEKQLVSYYFINKDKLIYSFFKIILTVLLVLLSFLPIILLGVIGAIEPALILVIIALAITVPYCRYKHKAGIGKIDSADVSEKQISVINADSTAFFTDGTRGTFLDIDYAFIFKEKEKVKVVKLNLTHTQKKLKKVSDTFIFKL